MVWDSYHTCLYSSKVSLVLWIGMDDPQHFLCRTLNRNHTWVCWTKGKCLLCISLWVPHGFQRLVGHRDASLPPPPFLTPCPVIHITVTNLLCESQFFPPSDRSSPELFITQSAQGPHLPRLWIYQNISFFLLLWPYSWFHVLFCLSHCCYTVTLVWYKQPLPTSPKSHITSYQHRTFSKTYICLM